MSKQPTKTQLEKIIRELEREKMVFDEAAGKGEERYRTIFECTGNATILIAEDTTILLANSNFASLTGYTREEMEGKMSWTVFIVSEDLSVMKEYHAKRRVRPDLAPDSYAFRLRTRTGDIRDILLTVALVILDEDVSLLKSHLKMTITIVGHTDSLGDPAYNQKLSEDRASAVMQYFIQKGITADRMKALGKGKSVPIADNKTEAGRAQNRRIEIQFTDPEPDVICK